ncbi:hypothetical protein [Arundinibacter roseus]|uniref:Uncharacterized protein n=1 Tax=Arundinibacter roseus TaxID=2070510 RepID=A0A4R4KL86_9BACT|nr:hypothetical protein [Arundinibacter roseus]TDB69104.1 hypothetical protein EZE20_01850 [Arundinibacter roseus]
MKTLSFGRFASPRAIEFIKQIRAEVCAHAKVNNNDKTDSRSLVYLGRNKVLAMYMRDFSMSREFGQEPFPRVYATAAIERAALRILEKEAPAIPEEVRKEIAAKFMDKNYHDYTWFRTRYGECVYFTIEISLKAILAK